MRRFTSLFPRTPKPEPLSDLDWRIIDERLRESPDRDFAAAYARAKARVGTIIDAVWQGAEIPQETLTQLASSGLLKKLEAGGQVQEFEKGKPLIELDMVAEYVAEAQAKSRTQAR